MPAPALGSILLATADPDRLRRWYEQAFEATPDPDGFLHFGEVAVLVDGRDDVAARNPEPARAILNFHVDDARATGAHLDRLAVQQRAHEARGRFELLHPRRLQARESHGGVADAGLGAVRD